MYRAKDTRLGREVAIKVLPAAVSSDAERLKRFENEAQAASALNHPNIVTIYDIGSSDGVSDIAMERVEDSTLAEILATGPLAIQRLLQIAPQVASGKREDWKELMPGDPAGSASSSRGRFRRTGRRFSTITCRTCPSSISPRD